MPDTIIRYSLPAEEVEIPEKEVLRYLGYLARGVGEEDLALAREHIPDVRSVMSPRACFGRFAIFLGQDGLIGLPWGEVTSADLTRNLKGCREVYVFAATIGLAFDRLLHRTFLRSMSDAAILQAVGAAAVEGFVDRLNADLKEEAAREGLLLKPRYSPGFGDFGLEQQRGLFRVLDPSRRIGLSLKENCIMTPEKSVTALIGIYEPEGETK